MINLNWTLILLMFACFDFGVIIGLYIGLESEVHPDDR